MKQPCFKDVSNVSSIRNVAETSVLRIVPIVNPILTKGYCYLPPVRASPGPELLEEGTSLLGFYLSIPHMFLIAQDWPSVVVIMPMTTDKYRPPGFMRQSFGLWFVDPARQGS